MRICYRQVWKFLVFAVIVHGHALAGDTAPPEGAALAAAQQLMREVYGARYEQAKTPTENVAFAKELLEQAGRSKGNLAEYFVLLNAARKVAGSNGDAETALRAVDALVETFDMDGLRMRLETVQEVDGAAKLPVQFKILAEQTLPLIDEATRVDDYDTADSLVKIAIGAASRARDYTLRRQIADHAKRATDLASRYSEIKEAFSVLRDNPVDPKCTSAVGKWYCFMKGEWEKGIPMLALGDDPALKALAIKELEGTDSTEAKIALGDGWWDLAGEYTGEAKDAMRAHAGHWYLQAETNLDTGLTKAKVRKRLEEITGVVPLSKPTDSQPKSSDSGRRGAQRPRNTIPATIDTELRLPRDNGPYELVGRVTVAQQGALYIERGTTILAAPGAALIATGKLAAYGDNGEFVRFRPAVAAPWDKIRLEKGAEHVIERFDIRGANTGLELGEDVNAQIVDCVLAQNKVGVATKRDDTKGRNGLTNCMISNNLSDGITFYLSKVGLEQCTVSTNGGVGLNLTYCGDVIVTSCNIVGNSVGVRSNLYKTNFTMKSSNIVGNRTATIEVNTEQDFQCQGNYWGTDDPQPIALSIIDGLDRPGRGVVVFTDFERKPVTEAGCSFEVSKESSGVKSSNLQSGAQKSQKR